jgi:hypothetical protein
LVYNTTIGQLLPNLVSLQTSIPPQTGCDLQPLVLNNTVC